MFCLLKNLFLGKLTLSLIFAGIFCMTRMTDEFTANLENAKKAEMAATQMVEWLKHMKR